MFCRYCGKTILLTDKKCKHCGRERESLDMCDGGSLEQIHDSAAMIFKKEIPIDNTETEKRE